MRPSRHRWVWGLGLPLALAGGVWLPPKVSLVAGLAILYVLDGGQRPRAARRALPPGAPLTERKESEWQRMPGYLHKQLRVHQRLTELPGRVFGSGHPRAVWGTYAHGPLDPQARVEGDEWWLPFTRGHAGALAERIAMELRARYDALPKRKNGWLPVPEPGIELGPGTRIEGGTVRVPGKIIAHQGHHTGVSPEEALDRGWARRVAP